MIDFRDQMIVMRMGDVGGIMVNTAMTHVGAAIFLMIRDGL
jgi:hypothetical protein